MNLSKVFAQALPFAGKVKDLHLAEVLKCVALYPDYRVMAQTDRVGVLIQADSLQPLQAPVLLPVDELKPVSGDLIRAELYAGLVRFWTTQTQYFDVPIRDPAGYPPILEFPKNWLPVDKADWVNLLGVIHAAAKGAAAPLVLQAVQILEDRIEATDQARVAMVFHGLPGVSGRVPLEVFNKWPKGDVRVGRTARTLWFAVGDQLRWARILDDSQYPDLTRFADPTWDKSAVVVKTKYFLDAVTRGLKVSKMRVMGLEFGTTEVVLRAFTGDSRDARESDKVAVTQYEAKVPCHTQVHTTAMPVQVLVDAKYLADAVRKLSTPNTRVVFTDHLGPVYLESGWHTEILWPRI